MCRRRLLALASVRCQNSAAPPVVPVGIVPVQADPDVARRAVPPVAAAKAARGVAGVRARRRVVAVMATAVSVVSVAVVAQDVAAQHAVAQDEVARVEVVPVKVAPHEVARVVVAPVVPEVEGAQVPQERGVRRVVVEGKAQIVDFPLGSRATRRSAVPLRCALAVAGSDARAELARTPHQSRRQSGSTKDQFGRRPSRRLSAQNVGAARRTSHPTSLLRSTTQAEAVNARRAFANAS